MQDYRLKLGLPVSIASAALILVWIFYYHSHGLYGTAPSGYPAHSILAVLLSILLVGFSLLPEMDFRFLRPLYFVARNRVRDLSVAYAHHYDSCRPMLQWFKHHEPAALLAVFAMYGCHHLRIRLFYNPFYRSSRFCEKERITSHERQNRS